MTSSLERRIESAEGTEGRPSLDEWVITTPVMLDGRPFAFEKHEYLVEPYHDEHPYQVEIKAAQLGLSTKAMLRALYACRFMRFRGVLYLFPSKSDVLDFSKARITPLIEDNPESIGHWVADTDAAGITVFMGPASLSRTEGIDRSGTQMTDTPSRPSVHGHGSA